jgi:LAO/AO transport system kinase
LAPTDRASIDDHAARVKDGDRRALSRAISWIEDRTVEGRTLLDRLYRPMPTAHRIGITGPPGSGKSTLVSELTRMLRSRGDTVGILAVDPSSPFSGGAILGDRIRMQAHQSDPGVFIRSMASRGSLGGLAAAAYEASEAMEAAGFDWILFETVGVGQSEMEVVGLADTTVLVLVPESGDAVQVMKAGLMEAGDVYVINKYDREGGDRLHKEISLMLELERERRAHEPAPPARVWERRLCRTVALRGEGILELTDGILAHAVFLREDAAAWRRMQAARTERRLTTQLHDRLLAEIWRAGHLQEWVRSGRERIERGDISPYALVDEMVHALLRRETSLGTAAAKGGER